MTASENRIAALNELAREMGRGGFGSDAGDYPARDGSPWGNAGVRGLWG